LYKEGEFIVRRSLQEKEYDLNTPIFSDEEMWEALQFISDQFYTIFDATRNLISEKIHEATFSNEFLQSAGLKKYEKTINEIRKSRSNIDSAVASVRNWILQKSMAIPNNAIIFEEINNWTESMAKFVYTYNKGLFPSVAENCKIYNSSLQIFNQLINLNNKIDPSQKIDYINYLPGDILSLNI
jgi:hypothetical protein